MRGSMKGLAWNCRGLNDPLAPTIAKLRAILSNNNKYDFVFLSETKCSVANVAPFCRPFGFSAFDGVDAVGSSGGLWLGWRRNVMMNVIAKSPNFVIVYVNQGFNYSWYLCCLYGEPRVERRAQVWQELEFWFSTFDCPFLVFGDFNQVEYSWDKWGKNALRLDGAEDFAKWKLGCQLIDIPFKGPRFTWCNNRKGNAKTYERLDKAMGSKDWLTAFPDSGVKHFPIQLSDHAPIEFSTCLLEKKGKRPYKMEAWNFEYEEVLELVRETWEEIIQGPPTVVLTRKLSLTRTALKVWSLDKKKEWTEKWSDFDNKLSEELENCFAGKDDAGYDTVHGQLKEFSRAAAIFWRQRAKMKWNVEGDTSTRYFFNWVKGRRGVNHILGIKEKEGMWTYDQQRIGDLFQGRFWKVYRPDSDDYTRSNYWNRFGDLFESNTRRLTEGDIESLGKPFTTQEIRTAVFQMGPLKSPGPDGVPASFFQKYWHVIKEDVTNAVQMILESGKVPKFLNKTFITLVPKIEAPESVDDFRPISLCNVAMKIVTKCIVNRLKGVMNNLVGDFQNAFVKGRNIGDNIMVAQEILCSINRHRQGKKGRMALKVDMSKAYDRISWNYVYYTLRSMNFPEKWVQLIMECVSTVSYEVLLNGTPLEKFEPKCGLRQGDPLSPYLFVLCTEILSQNLARAERLSGLQGIKASRNSPPVSHLFFADDSLFFLEGNDNAIHCLRDILDCYCAASGQRVNNTKSAIVFSPSCTLNMVRTGLNSFNVKPCTDLGVYLGTPTMIGASKRRTFQSLVENIRARISSWNGVFLSPAGRLTLINSILSSLSVFSLSVFRIPASVANKINALLAHFWWAGVRQSRTIHWCSTNFLSLPKSKGGLGIRNVVCLNQALLAKQAWRIVTKRETLLSKVFYNKYSVSINESGLIDYMKPTTSSWTWKGISWGMELINANIAWKIGWKSQVNMWSTRWVDGKIPVPKSGCGLVDHTAITDWKVGRVQENGWTWDEKIIREVFTEEWSKKILAIPVSIESSEDNFYWMNTRTGEYDVKSGYGVAIQRHFDRKATRKDVARTHKKYSTFSKNIWKLPGPPRWKVLLWKIINNCLPLGEEFSRRNIGNYHGCSLCGKEDQVESYAHLFRDCDSARRLWFGSALGIRCMENECTGVEQWICNWLSYLGRREDEDLETKNTNKLRFLCVIWVIWVSRNNVIFRKQEPDPSSMVYTLKALESEWLQPEKRDGNKVDAVSPSQVARVENRDFQVAGSKGCFLQVIVLVDAAWMEDRRAAAGWTLLVNGEVKEEITTTFYAQTAAQAEAKGIQEVLLWARRKGIYHVSVLTDCLQVVNEVGGLQTPGHHTSSIIKDIISLAVNFHCFNLAFVPRTSVKRAHNLAKSVMRT